MASVLRLGRTEGDTTLYLVDMKGRVPFSHLCGRGRLINGPNLSPEQLRQVIRRPIILRLDSS